MNYRTHMLRRILLVIFFFITALGGIFIPESSVNAQEQCACVCNSPGGIIRGATTTKGEANSVCRRDCAARGDSVTYQTCTTDLGIFEYGSAKCWSADECANRTVDVNGKERGSDWQKIQPNDCPDGYHYCYNPQIPVDLNIAIKTLENPKQAANLGEYIAAIYDLLLPVGALIAVVLVMIAGLQYLLAGGNQTAIQQARSRIGKAVTGLVLVLFAYTIVYTIDPRLTSFDALRIPVLKGAVFIDEDSTCLAVIEAIGAENVEYIRSTTDPDEAQFGEQACGAICQITDVPDGTVLAGQVQVGDMFFDDFCYANDTKCIISGGGDMESRVGTCARCWDIYPGNEYNLTPSPSTCAEFDPVDKLRNDDGSFDSYKRCFFTRDAEVVPGSAIDAQTYVSGGSCALFGFSCNAVSSCSDYGKQYTVAGPPPQAGQYAAITFLQYITGQGGDIGYISDLENGAVTYQEVCNANPCGVPSGCVFNNSREGVDKCYSPE